MRFNYNLISKYLYFGILVLGIFIIFVDFAYLKLNTADGSIYLSTAENIASHKGFVVSYNLCQFFNTLYYPIWPYYQYLYTLLCSLLIKHGGILQVIKANILFFAFNATLVFYMIRKLMPSRLNILFIFYLIFSFNFYISALYVWTEQFHLFCFLVTFLLFLKYSKQPKHLVWIGFLNGICMLIRVAHLFNFLAYLPFIFLQKDSWKMKFKRAIAFAGGFILFYGLYQLFCWCSYHAFYPQYAQPGANYGQASYVGGLIYSPDKVGIQITLGPVVSLLHFSYIKQHLIDLFHQMPFFLLPALFYYFLPENKKQDGGIIALCFYQSILTILGYSFTYYWLTYSFDSLRYSLIPFVLVSLSGWYCLYQWLWNSEKKAFRLICMLILVSLLVPNLFKFIKFRNILNYPRWERPYYRDLFESYRWINSNLPKEVLVASNEDQEAYFMHRPYISIPPNRSYNCTNLYLYNKIYSPDYYLLSSHISNKCFDSGLFKYANIFSNKTFRILEIKKD